MKEEDFSGTGAEVQPAVGPVAFDALARELFALQYEHNAAYRRICESRGVCPAELSHWSEIPSVPTAAFKELELSCLPAEERGAVFHSSGTTEQRPSRHFHNAESLSLYEASALPWFRQHLASDVGDGVKPPMMVLTPPQSEAPHSSLVHMFELVRRELGGAQSAFWGKADAEGVWNLDATGAVDALLAEARAGRPVVVLGTAFLFVHLVDYLAGKHLRLQLPAGSRVLETGGYKGRSRSLPKAELHGLISKHFGIPEAQIICEYGMSELSSQAYDRKAGSAQPAQPDTRRFVFPPWARVQIISPETGREVGQGQTGLIRVFDLANAFSVMALQTEDLGVRRGVGFELLGRAAMAEPRGCSLMAS